MLWQTKPFCVYDRHTCCDVRKQSTEMIVTPPVTMQRQWKTVLLLRRGRALAFVKATTVDEETLGLCLTWQTSRLCRHSCNLPTTCSCYLFIYHDIMATRMNADEELDRWSEISNGSGDSDSEAEKSGERGIWKWDREWIANEILPHQPSRAVVNEQKAHCMLSWLLIFVSNCCQSKGMRLQPYRAFLAITTHSAFSPKHWSAMT